MRASFKGAGSQQNPSPVESADSETNRAPPQVTPEVVDAVGGFESPKNLKQPGLTNFKSAKTVDDRGKREDLVAKPLKTEIKDKLVEISSDDDSDLSEGAK